jgi:predicted nucleotidyltransferase component of viral defense system
MDGGIFVECYCFEELFAEKIRALAERLRPRDLYDVIHIYRHNHLIQNHSTVITALEKKCKYKDVLIPTIDSA